MEPNVTTRCEHCGMDVATAQGGNGGLCLSCDRPIRPPLTDRAELLQKQGEVLFGSIAPQLNRLQPGRERTRDEFDQVCIALALFVHHLLDSDGEET